jgi:hypothetical protein
MSDFEKLVKDAQTISDKCAPTGHAGIFDVAIEFNNPNIKAANYPELKLSVSHNPDLMSFGRNHYYGKAVRKSVYFDGEDVCVPVERKDFRDYQVSATQMTVTLRDRKLVVTLNDHSTNQRLDEILE